MYKINSLKRLNKSDLIKIGQNSNLETYNCTKVELINKLVDAGLCESPLSSGSVSRHYIACPIRPACRLPRSLSKITTLLLLE